ncbi:MAG: hypothetical protein GXP24_01825, partial [Planctomycetes bacterium]|nr:hypothetical protein [Planctomycetota bacterium]
MRIRLRTLFLITTVVAIVAFSFTLGVGEGLIAMLFFACIFGPRKKKDRWKYGIWLVLLVVWMGLFTRYRFRSHVPGLRYGYSACVDIILTGFSERHQGKVLQFIESEPPFNDSSIFDNNSLATISPFFR